jgi:hypothetical protein
MQGYYWLHLPVHLHLSDLIGWPVVWVSYGPDKLNKVETNLRVDSFREGYLLVWLEDFRLES